MMRGYVRRFSDKEAGLTWATRLGSVRMSECVLVGSAEGDEVLG